MAMLESNYMVKPSSIGEPNFYLGANVRKVIYGDDSYTWNMIYDSYVKESIKNVKKRNKEDGLEYNNNISEVNCSPQNPF